LKNLLLILVIEAGGRHVSLVDDTIIFTSFIASHHGLSCMANRILHSADAAFIWAPVTARSPSAISWICPWVPRFCAGLDRMGGFGRVGRWPLGMVANSESHTLVILDAGLYLVRSYAAAAIGGMLFSGA